VSWSSDAAATSAVSAVSLCTADRQTDRQTHVTTIHFSSTTQCNKTLSVHTQDVGGDECRGRQMQLLRRLCLPSLCTLLHEVLHSTQRYKQCVQIADCIADEHHQLYKVTYQHHHHSTVALSHSLWSPYVIGQTIIFSSCRLFFFFFSFLA